MDKKKHDLFDFMQQVSAEMSSEYKRIQARATEDPGTAGDQGEENWAELLRDWLPRSYEVITKGRIISQEGVTSPQIDILVLKGDYPKKLINKKLYLAAGVAAAFECKTTLRISHITEVMENCEKIKNLYPTQTGTPYKELHTPLIYGLLAHSHSWKGLNSTPEQNIEEKLIESDSEFINHPRLQLDLLCVSDLATWSSLKTTYIGPQQVPDWTTLASVYGANGSATSTFMAHTRGNELQVDHFTPIGVLISRLIQKLAWYNSSTRELADYFRIANLAGSGRGLLRLWPSSIYSEEIRPSVEAGKLSNGKPWDEWSVTFL